MTGSADEGGRLVVLTWTGLEVHALRRAMRLTVREFAEVTGKALRTVTSWEAEYVKAKLRPESQASLDEALSRQPAKVVERFGLIATLLRDAVTATSGTVNARKVVLLNVVFVRHALVPAASTDPGGLSTGASTVGQQTDGGRGADVDEEPDFW